MTNQRTARRPQRGGQNSSGRHPSSAPATPDTAQRNSTSAGTQGPIHEIRLGRIRAAIWENEYEGSLRHNVNVGRIYKTDEQWKETHSFGRDDLLLVAKVLDLCHSWIFHRIRSVANQPSP